jgi:hypothetical protein
MTIESRGTGNLPWLAAACGADHQHCRLAMSAAGTESDACVGLFRFADSSKLIERLSNRWQPLQIVQTANFVDEIRKTS